MKKKTGMILLIVPVFLLYFISEAFLRCAAVANINPDKVKLDNILNDLPESVRDIVTYRIMYTDITNALARASTEEEKLSLLAQLGEYTRNLREKENIFKLLRRKYPERPEAAAAFVYYLLRKDSPDQISVPEFHRYLLKFPQLERYNIWAMALNRLAQLNVPEPEKMNFMLPLLKMKPEYRDYSILYTELVRLGTKYRNPDLANRADALIDESRLQASIAEVQLAQETQKQAKHSAEKDTGKRK
ncbi:MAG: hypothetical protein J5858_02015 [Lentisphaeria bacterium]|nr:hypothetical protein [Lentisphaeria bacterium]